MITAVHELGLETCATLGMLDRDQAEQLRDAGLDYYNHNIDTSESFYPSIITTRTYRERLDTLQTVRDAGLKVCCGGILGMGESREDWAQMLHTLATQPEHPGSVPINQLVRVPGTPLADAADVDPLDFVRVIAASRILMPASHLRLSAGRTEMADEMQALCFFAGANSIFYGEKLLTTANPAHNADLDLLRRLGMRPEAAPAGSSSSGIRAAASG
jgi:biotin synthase